MRNDRSVHLISPPGPPLALPGWEVAVGSQVTRGCWTWQPKPVPGALVNDKVPTDELDATGSAPALVKQSCTCWE